MRDPLEAFFQLPFAHGVGGSVRIILGARLSLHFRAKSANGTAEYSELFAAVVLQLPNTRAAHYPPVKTCVYKKDPRRTVPEVHHYPQCLWVPLSLRCSTMLDFRTSLTPIAKLPAVALDVASAARPPRRHISAPITVGPDAQRFLDGDAPSRAARAFGGKCLSFSRLRRTCAGRVTYHFPCNCPCDTPAEDRFHLSGRIPTKSNVPSFR